VICEKPLASNLQEVKPPCAGARKPRGAVEAFKTASLPNFLLLKQSLESGQTAQSLYQLLPVLLALSALSRRRKPNTFNPAFSNGSIMDIGFYCLASAVALWGEPRGSRHRQPAGQRRGCQGTVVLSYGDFDVTLHHSKVSDSALPSEIQGEAGALVIEKISECQKGVCAARRQSAGPDAASAY
jgi:predicted dehydrogenase